MPAYNEEKNIGRLLDDILSQKCEVNTEDCSIEEIVIVSDRPTDSTNDIVLAYGKIDNIIRLIKRDYRYGKPSALNMIFEEANKCDILILLDADVRLEKNALRCLIDGMLEHDDIDMIGGNPVPSTPNDFNVAEYVSFFGWKLQDEIKTKCNENLYHSHGRMLALTRRLFNDLKIPDTAKGGDDQYIYLSCIKKGMKFKYEPKSKVIFKLPKDINDHLRQSLRFTESINQNGLIFGKDFVEHNMKIGNKLIFIQPFIRNPFKGSLWLLARAYGKLLYRKSEIGALWEISKTTK